MEALISIGMIISTLMILVMAGYIAWTILQALQKKKDWMSLGRIFVICGVLMIVFRWFSGYFMNMLS